MTIWLGATPSGLTSAHLHLPNFFYGPDALPTAQPTVSKHWRLIQTHLKLKWRLWCFNGYAHNTIITTKYNNADKYFHHLVIAVLALYSKVSNYCQQVTGTNVNVFILEHLAPLLSSLHLIQLGFFLTLVLLTQSLPLSLNVLHSQKHSQPTSDMDTLCNKNEQLLMHNQNAEAQTVAIQW